MLLGMPQPLMGKNKAPAFSLSGAWSDLDGGSLDGWVVSSGNAPFVRDNYPRSAPSGLYFANGGAATVDYTLLGSATVGLTITASVWARHGFGGSATTRSIQYRLGAGSFVTLQTVSNTSATYAQLSGSFGNAAGEDVTIRIGGMQYAAFDDWAISGA